MSRSESGNHPSIRASLGHGFIRYSEGASPRCRLAKPRDVNRSNHPVAALGTRNRNPDLSALYATAEMAGASPATKPGGPGSLARARIIARVPGRLLLRL